MTILDAADSGFSSGQQVCNKWTGRHLRTGAEWNLYCGDALEILPRLSRGVYSCVITSPPYFWQRDYGVEGQIGVEHTVGEYVDAICRVMDELKGVLHPRGILFLNLGDTYYSGKGRPHGADRKHNGRRFPRLRAVDKSGLGPPKKTLLGMPWRVALGMIDRGWLLRSAIVWKRKRPIPEPNVLDRPWRAHEFVFLFAKSRQYHFDRTPLLACGEEDVWTIESQSRPGRTHPAVFPSELVKRCLDLGVPEFGPVLDPFAGSGTVMQVALDRGVPADGIDLNPGFCHSIARVLNET